MSTAMILANLLKNILALATGIAATATGVTVLVRWDALPTWMIVAGLVQGLLGVALLIALFFSILWEDFD